MRGKRFRPPVVTVLAEHEDQRRSTAVFDLMRRQKVIKLDNFSNQTRREFCACCSKAVGLLALGGAAGCGGSPTSPSNTGQPLASVTATVSGRTVTVPTTGNALATAGGMAIAQTSIGIFLVTRTSASAATC
jgi:hypothetical protein